MRRSQNGQRQRVLLRKLSDAGFVAIVAPSDISQSEWLVRYEQLSREALATIDHLRDSLAGGIERGNVQLAPTFILDEDQSEFRLANHPSFGILSAATLADVLVIDDRHFNQHGTLSGDFGSRPVWSTYDIISFHSTDLSELVERVTSLRRAGFCYVPLRPEELITLVKAAHVADGGIVETAELKAIRENLLQNPFGERLARLLLQFEIFRRPLESAQAL